MKPTSAMIFAAGFGTRMSPLTDDLPKPMVPLAGRPMIDRAIDWILQAGIKNIVANTHYLPGEIIPYLKDQNILVSDEQPDILDTGGGLRAALPLMDKGPVITINPDALWLGQNPVTTLLEAWDDCMCGLLSLIAPDRCFGSSSAGDFSLEQGKIQRTGPYLYGGAQIIDPLRLHEIPETVFSLNAYWDLLAEDAPLNGVLYDGDWYDIGHVEGLKLAEDALASV